MLTISQATIPPGWFGITRPTSLAALADYLREQLKLFLLFPKNTEQMYWREVEKLNSRDCRYVSREPNPRYVASHYHLAAFAIRQGLAWLREEEVPHLPALDVPERTPASVTLNDLGNSERALVSLIAFVEKAARELDQAQHRAGRECLAAAYETRRHARSVEALTNESRRFTVSAWIEHLQGALAEAKAARIPGTDRDSAHGSAKWLASETLLAIATAIAGQDVALNPDDSVSWDAQAFEAVRQAVADLQRIELPPVQAPDLTAPEASGERREAVKGTPGRRGYPLEALNHARQLRAKHPTMKAAALRTECLKHFPEDDLPPDGESFRRWLNRKRANRAN